MRPTSGAARTAPSCSKFGDDIDLTDLRDALLKEYPLEKYPPEEDE